MEPINFNDIYVDFVARYGEMSEYPDPDKWIDLLRVYCDGYGDGYADGVKAGAQAAAKEIQRRTPLELMRLLLAGAAIERRLEKEAKG